MKKSRRNPEYWTVRYMLAFAIVAPPPLYLLVASMNATGPMFIPSPGPNWGGPAVLAVGAGLWLAGVIRMIRIFRGLGDVPPPWRYRDR